MSISPETLKFREEIINFIKKEYDINEINDMREFSINYGLEYLNDLPLKWEGDLDTRRWSSTIWKVSELPDGRFVKFHYSFGDENQDYESINSDFNFSDTKWSCVKEVFPVEELTTVYKTKDEIVKSSKPDIDFSELLDCIFKYVKTVYTECPDYKNLDDEEINDILDEMVGWGAYGKEVLSVFDVEFDDWYSEYKHVIKVHDDRYIAVQCRHLHACDYDTHRFEFNYKEHIKEIFPYNTIGFKFKD